MLKILSKLFIKDNKNVANPKVRAAYGALSGTVGIVSNFILFGVKFFISIIANSVAIQADAFNNLSDAGSSIVSLVGFHLSSKPADDGHPFGHGRYEYISGFIVSVAILIMGFELATSSIDAIINPQKTIFNIYTILAMVVSVLIKIWLCFFNKKIGALIKSESVKASSLDSLSDAIATSALVTGMIISYTTGINLDGYLGIIISAFILFTGIKSCRDTLNPLIGQSPDTEFVKGIEETLMAHELVLGMHDLIVHSYGAGNTLISLHAEIPAEASIFETHDLIDNIEKELKDKFKCEAVIHMDPVSSNDELTASLKKSVIDIVQEIDPILSIHDFRIVPGPTHTNIIFDIVTPHRFRLTDETLINELSAKVKQLDERYCLVVTVDKAFVQSK